jgi:hypothetical protein
MHLDVLQHEAIVERDFAAWSVEIPATFAHAFLDEDGTWHRGACHQPRCPALDPEHPMTSTTFSTSRRFRRAEVPAVLDHPR